MNETEMCTLPHIHFEQTLSLFCLFVFRWSSGWMVGWLADQLVSSLNVQNDITNVYDFHFDSGNENVAFVVTQNAQTPRIPSLMKILSSKKKKTK